MRSINSGQELDDHPVSTTLRQHSPTHRSAGTLTEERKEVKAGRREEEGNGMG